MAQQPKKKVLLTPERTMEVADSLDKESGKKRTFAMPQKRIAEAGIKRGEGDKQLFEKGITGITYSLGPTANERMKIANDALGSADKDKENADRYRKLAEDSKKKVPTPNTRKQIQDMEMMKEKIRQNKVNDKSNVIKLMKKIIK